MTPSEFSCQQFPEIALCHNLFPVHCPLRVTKYLEHPEADIVPVDTVLVATMRTVVFHTQNTSFPNSYQHGHKPPPLGTEGKERGREENQHLPSTYYSVTVALDTWFKYIYLVPTRFFSPFSNNKIDIEDLIRLLDVTQDKVLCLQLFLTLKSIFWHLNLA